MNLRAESFNTCLACGFPFRSDAYGDSEMATRISNFVSAVREDTVFYNYEGCHMIDKKYYKEYLQERVKDDPQRGRQDFIGLEWSFSDLKQSDHLQKFKDHIVACCRRCNQLMTQVSNMGDLSTVLLGREKGIFGTLAAQQSTNKLAGREPFVLYCLMKAAIFVRKSRDMPKEKRMDLIRCEALASLYLSYLAWGLTDVFICSSEGEGGGKEYNFTDVSFPLWHICYWQECTKYRMKMSELDMINEKRDGAKSDYSAWWKENMWNLRECFNEVKNRMQDWMSKDDYAAILLLSNDQTRNFHILETRAHRQPWKLREGFILKHHTYPSIDQRFKDYFPCMTHLKDRQRKLSQIKGNDLKEWVEGCGGKDVYMHRMLLRVFWSLHWLNLTTKNKDNNKDSTVAQDRWEKANVRANGKVTPAGNGDGDQGDSTVAVRYSENIIPMRGRANNSSRGKQYGKGNRKDRG